MGGKLEDEVETVRKPRGKSGSEAIGKIRFHESAGEVHFHDDAEKLKVAVPVHVWSDLWARLSSGGPDAGIAYLDAKNCAWLEVELVKKDGKVDAVLLIEKVSFGDAFAKLQKFTDAA